METSFYAYISRMRHIMRWGLMRSVMPENLQEHSHMTAVIAHALAVIRRDIFKEDADPYKTAVAALFHDASEILTGDMPTPIKYRNPIMLEQYKAIERESNETLLSFLPEELRPAYKELLIADEASYEYKLVKAADRLCAYIKCIEELRSGNGEFGLAKKQIEQLLYTDILPETEYFIEHFMSSFELTIDEL